MTSRIPSSSALPLVRLCQASWALPHLGRSRGSGRSVMGDALHQHMHHRTMYGVGEAMRLVDQVARAHELTEREAGIFGARCRHFEWCPPPGAFGEVALCLPEGGDVVRMVGAKGQYTWPQGAVTGGTLDLMWSEPQGLDLTDPQHPRCPAGDVLWVPDLKTGDDAWVEPVEHNYQVRTNALLAAKWVGATRAVPAVIYWRKGQGEWDVPIDGQGRVVPWGPRDLRAHEADVRALLADVREEQRKAAAGEDLNLVEGKHCEFCPARTRCAVHTALIKRVASGDLARLGDAPLTPAERVWVASNLGMIERLAKTWRNLLIADVKLNGPVVMTDGNVWGPHPQKKTKILVDQALPVLRSELGPDLAAGTVKREIPAGAIDDAAKELLHQQGKTRGAAPIARRIMAKLGEAGALVDEGGIQFGAHKAKPTVDTEAGEAEDLDD